MSGITALPELLQRIQTGATTLYNSGLLHPGFLTATLTSMQRWGQSIASGIAGSASRRPADIGLIDDLGTLTFLQLHERSNAMANGLAAAGIKANDGVGILCRNHRGFVEATLAVTKIGADALFLNTGFAGPQLGEVLDREGCETVIFDEEFTNLIDQYGGDRARYVAWHDGDSNEPTLDDLLASHSKDEPEAAKPGRTTILTSGTTGTPKGARRESQSSGIDTLVGILGIMPYQVGETTMIVAPTFHAWGLAQLLMGSILSSTLVFRRKFDPEDTLAAVDHSKATAMAVVPVMMQRILALDPEVIAKHDTSSLRIVAASGSALPGELAIRWMDTLGDNLYNFYGSTEVAQTSIAAPRDLRAAPGTAGRPPAGTIVKILDDNGFEVPAGTTGRIFVANSGQFEGYTGGGGKEVVDGLMSIGDVGYVDQEGRLFVEGRDDDMIVSGGENVFPIEIENLLADHDAIYEVAVIGVPDEEFGQRLKAFVVLKPDASLSEDEAKAYVKQHLARYKVPREVRFMEEIPRNQTGKVLKRVLKEMD